MRELFFATLMLSSCGTDKTDNAAAEADTDTDTDADTDTDTDTDADTDACLGMSPAELDFGELSVSGGASVTQFVQLSNDCTVDLNVLDVAIEEGVYSLEPVSSSVLLAGQALPLQVTFEPVTDASSEATIAVSVDDSVGLYEIPVRGEGIAPAFSAPDELSFSGVPVGCTVSEDLVLSNAGRDVLDISSVNPTGTSNEVSLELDEGTNGALPWELKPGEAVTVSVSYSPSDTFGDTLYLFWSTNDPLQPEALVRVSGSAVEAGDCPE